MRAQQHTYLLAALLIVASSTACGPRAANVAGTWEGMWTDPQAQSGGTFRVEIQQRGKSLSGPITLSLDWMPQAHIEGIVEGQTVRWGVLRERLVMITFEGRVSGDAAQGSYAIGTTTRGSWEARRVER